MARIRTIKPEFFTSEDIVSLSPLARLLYIALWCESDREGRLLWKPRTFKLRYLPADDCDVEALCSELVAAELVKLYGDAFAHIPKFGLHQHLNPRESASTLPDPDETRTRRARVNHASTTRQPRDSDAQGGREGKGRSNAPTPDEVDAPAPPMISLPLNDGTEHPVSSAMVSEWSASFPAVDVPQALRTMRAWLAAKPARRKTARGVNAFVVGWLGREQDSGRRGRVNGHDDPFAGAL
jgi:hypothetical protein